MQKENNLKLISKSLMIAIGATTLIGCSGSSGVNNSTPTDDTVSEVSDKKNTPDVKFSHVSTIPTNNKSIGAHYFHLENYTGKNLKLENFKVTSSDHNGILNTVADKVSRAIGGAGYDPRVNLLGCKTLVSNNSCTVAFTPDSLDGSTGLQVNFKDDNGKEYSAAQLINYSSNMIKGDGFYASNSGIQNIISKNNYTLDIPYLTDDDYESISAKSKVITIEQSNSCLSGAKKGTHCTASFTLPVNEGVNYANEITLTGTKTDGSTRSITLRNSATFGNVASVAISEGPIVITAKNDKGKNQGKVILVNNSNKPTKVTEAHEYEYSWLNGIQDKTYLTKTTACGDMSASDICEVTFNLDNSEASGSDNYKITYDDGEEGASTTKITKIYYRGLTNGSGGSGGSGGGTDTTIKLSDYELSGNLDFKNTLVGKTREGYLTVKNTGKEVIKGIKLEGLTSIAGFTINNTTGMGDCGDTTQLNNNDSCSFRITYAPKNPAAASLTNVTVTANDNADKPITPARKLALQYSASDAGGNGLIFVNRYPILTVIANGTNKVVSKILIQNVGNTDYELKNVSLTKGVWPAGLSISAENTTGSNPLSGISFTNGTVKESKTIRADKTGELTYTYGPVNEQVAANTTVQKFDGNFSDGQFSSNLVEISYEASKSGIVIVDPVVVDPQKPDVIDPTGPGVIVTDPETGKPTVVTEDKNELVLIKANPAKIRFKYEAAGDQNAFLVNDNNLPFGYMVDAKETTCPTTSKGIQKGVTLKDKEVCSVVYTYLDTNLDHPLFYTLATLGNGIRKISIPPYTVSDGKGNTKLVQLTQDFKFTPKAYASIIEKAEYNKNASNASDSQGVYTLKFDLSDYAAKIYKDNSFSGIATAAIKVAPIFDDSVWPVSASNCELSSAEPKCEIEVVSADRKVNKKLFVTYSSTIDGSYNSLYNFVTLTAQQ